MKKIAVLLAVFVFFTSGCNTEEKKTSKENKMSLNTYKSISMQEAEKIMQTSNDFILLDVRTQGEYSSGHIPGAILLTNETISPQTVKILPDKNKLLLVYCRSGRRSKQAAEKLVALGYKNILEIGGILSWKGELEY